MNILITDTSSYKSIVLSKYIKLNYPNCKVFTCDTRNISKLIHTKYTDKYIFIKCKIKEGEKYFNSLCRIIEDNNIDICFPVNNREMKVLMAFRDRFPKALNYWGAEDEYCNLDNKDFLYEILKKEDILLPKRYYSIDEAIPPFVFKPVNLSSSKGVIYIHTDKEKFKVSNKKGKYILQEYIFGYGAGYSAFCLNGKILTGYAHKRLAEFPIKGGSSVYRENFDNINLKKISELILSKVNWSGFIMFEFKVTKDNRIYFIEANPRIWGSINQGLQNNIDYMSSILSNKKITNNSIDIRTYFSPLIYISLFIYLINGKFSIITNFLKNIRKNKSDVSIIRDFFGWLSFINIIYEEN